MQNFLSKKTNGKATKAIAAASTGIATFMMTNPVYASFQAYNGTNTNQMMNGAKTFFGNVGTYGGALYGLAAIFTLVLAIRNEDNEGRNKALLNLLCAALLLSLGVIIKLFFS